MIQTLIHILIAVAVLIVCWLVVARFSPDPLITKICQIIIFVIALILVLTLLVPMVGVHL